MTDAYIHAQALGAKIDNRPILHDVNFSLHKGSVTSVIGPSGSGKSTLLKSIAGFQKLSSGKLSINGNDIVDINNRLHTNAEQRPIGVVFQDAPLFQHMSVEENIRAGIKRSRDFAPVKNEGDIINYLIEMMQLQHLQYRYAHELSGGQQQRVALARALAMNTPIMLLDEPFANLNEDLHMQIAEGIFNWFYEQGTTVMLVTHDQYDAMAISDNVLVLMDGTSVQQDRADKLFEAPANMHIAKFVNRGVLIEGQVKQAKQNTLAQAKHNGLQLHYVKQGLAKNNVAAANNDIAATNTSMPAMPIKNKGNEMISFIATPFGNVKIKSQCLALLKQDSAAYLWAQPEDFVVVCVNDQRSDCFEAGDNDNPSPQGTITRIIWRTTDILLHVDCPQIKLKDGSQNILVKVSQSGAFHRTQPFKKGQKVRLSLKNHEYNVYS